MAKWYCPDPEYSQMSESEYNIRCKLEKIMEGYSRDMSTSHWYGSANGVPEDNYEDVAEDIMTELNLWDADKDAL